jgi:trans-2,3-dihydro-3-hydroxyanthranilate isomerase
MKGLSFYLVDVFTDEKYAGNQLAVVADAGKLSGVQMQRIANEFHFSETAFILSHSMRKGGYDVRIFTPQTELPFAGHPTCARGMLGGCLRGSLLSFFQDTPLKDHA